MIKVMTWMYPRLALYTAGAVGGQLGFLMFLLTLWVWMTLAAMGAVHPPDFPVPITPPEPLEPLPPNIGLSLEAQPW